MRLIKETVKSMSNCGSLDQQIFRGVLFEAVCQKKKAQITTCCARLDQPIYRLPCHFYSSVLLSYNAFYSRKVVQTNAAVFLLPSNNAPFYHIIVTVQKTVYLNCLKMQ